MPNEQFASLLKSFGHGNTLAAVSFVPGATPTIIDQLGVKSVARNGGAGLYRITLNDKYRSFIAIVGHTENDTTLYHVVRVEARSFTNSTIDISHKSVAFASVASGPTASDTVDSIEVFILAVG